MEQISTVGRQKLERGWASSILTQYVQGFAEMPTRRIYPAHPLITQIPTSPLVYREQSARRYGSRVVRRLEASRPLDRARG